jgi:Tol biopolymer transport system component
VSPDGSTIVFIRITSDTSADVYACQFPPFPRKEGRSPNGKELFYRDANRMMVVEVTESPDLVLSSPRMLFEQRYSYGIGGTTANYDVSPNGQHFVMVKDESASGRLNVVLNWVEELKRLWPTK